jgi:hypothetical protein
MKLQRRRFLKAVTTGLAVECANGAFGQASKRGATGEVETGCESLRLSGKLKSGELTLEANQFFERRDRSVIVRGKLESTELYSAMFSYRKDLTVFAIFNDNGHSTTITLSNSSDPKIGQVVVWNDDNTPQVFKVDKRKIMETENEIMDTNGKSLDLIGKRNQAAFTWEELESLFGSNEALWDFMRGRKSTHHPLKDEEPEEWICRLVSRVPGSLLSLFWLA